MLAAVLAGWLLQSAELRQDILKLKQADPVGEFEPQSSERFGGLAGGRSKSLLLPVVFDVLVPGSSVQHVVGQLMLPPFGTVGHLEV